MQRTFGRRGDEGKIDGGLHDLGELDLGLLCRFLQALERHPVLGEIHTVSVLELLGQPVDDPLVPVIPTQVGVARRGLDLEHALADLQQRDVERPTAQVEDEDGLVVLLIQAVGERGCRRLVDDPKHFEPRDLPGLLGGLALRIVEVRRNRDDRLGHLVAQIGFRIPLQLAQDLG